MNRRHILKLLCGGMILPVAASADALPAFSADRPLMGALIRIKTYSGDAKPAEKATGEA